MCQQIKPTLTLTLSLRARGLKVPGFRIKPGMTNLTHPHPRVNNGAGSNPPLEREGGLKSPLRHLFSKGEVGCFALCLSGFVREKY